MEIVTGSEAMEDQLGVGLTDLRTGRIGLTDSTTGRIGPTDIITDRIGTEDPSFIRLDFSWAM